MHSLIYTGNTGFHLEHLPILGWKIGVEHEWQNVCFSYDSRWIAISEGHFGVRIFSTDRYARLGRSLCHVEEKDADHIELTSDQHEELLRSVGVYRHGDELRLGVLGRIMFSLDAKCFVSGNSTFQTSDGSNVTGCRHQKQSWRLFAVAPSSTLGAVASVDNSISIWRFKDGRIIKTCLESSSGYSKFCTTITFSPDGRLFAAAFPSGFREDEVAEVLVWELRRKTAPRRYLGCAGEIESIGFSPCASQLAAVFKNGTSRIWDVTSGNCLLEIEGKVDCDAVFSHSIYAVSGASGLQILTATGILLARLPRPVELLRTHPCGNIWAGAIRHQLVHCSLDDLTNDIRASSAILPRWSTAVRRWTSDGTDQGVWADYITLKCPWCRREDVKLAGDVIERLQDNAATASKGTYLDFSDGAWDDATLRLKCPECDGPIVLTPFAADLRHLWDACLRREQQLEEANRQQDTKQSGWDETGVDGVAFDEAKQAFDEAIAVGELGPHVRGLLSIIALGFSVWIGALLLICVRMQPGPAGEFLKYFAWCGVISHTCWAAGFGFWVWPAASCARERLLVIVGAVGIVAAVPLLASVSWLVEVVCFSSIPMESANGNSLVGKGLLLTVLLPTVLLFVATFLMQQFKEQLREGAKSRRWPLVLPFGIAMCLPANWSLKCLPVVVGVGMVICGLLWWKYRKICSFLYQAQKCSAQVGDGTSEETNTMTSPE